MAIDPTRLAPPPPPDGPRRRPSSTEHALLACAIVAILALVVLAVAGYLHWAGRQSACPAGSSASGTSVSCNHGNAG
jgi:hypothetical protein